ncbi:MAG: hypothetical protein JNM69_13955 [Archangium sp.]|nr:hypothetical protein [Archangium sp.]
MESLFEALFWVFPAGLAAGALFNLVTFIEELSEVRAGRPAGSRLRTAGLLVISVGLVKLGLVAAITDPRHGSEIVGWPMLAAAAVGGLAFGLRLRRHLRRSAR